MNWKEEFENNTITLDVNVSGSDIEHLPDDELFDNPVDRPLPCAPLPTIETSFGLILFRLIHTIYLFAICGRTCLCKKIYTGRNKY